MTNLRRDLRFVGRLRGLASAALAAALVLLPILALANEEGEAAHGSAAGGAEHHAPSPWGLVYPVINFALYSFILWKYAWPAARDYLPTAARTP